MSSPWFGTPNGLTRFRDPPPSVPQAVILIAWQTVRVIRRDQRLSEANTALSSANKELFQINVDLETANQTIQEQNDRRSRFFSAMSHDLRTPLTAIKGYANNLIDGIGGELNERQQRSVGRIGRNSDHMLNLVNDLLDIARIEAGRIEINPVSFSIDDTITACCETVSPLTKPGVELKHDIADDIGQIHTDEGRVRQILINLLSNALKFTDEGHVLIRATRDSDNLILSVSDTGTGIPQEDQSTIFEEFKQVKGSDPQHKGTGLGLPITRAFTRLLGGDIRVESEVGKGSTFTVSIPTTYQSD